MAFRCPLETSAVCKTLETHFSSTAASRPALPDWSSTTSSPCRRSSVVVSSGNQWIISSNEAIFDSTGKRHSSRPTGRTGVGALVELMTNLPLYVVSRLSTLREADRRRLKTLQTPRKRSAPRISSFFGSRNWSVAQKILVRIRTQAEHAFKGALGFQNDRKSIP